MTTSDMPEEKAARLAGENTALLERLEGYAEKKELYRFYCETMQHAFHHVWDYSKTFQPRLFGLLSIFAPLTVGGFLLAREIARGIKAPWLDHCGGLLSIVLFGLFSLWAFGRVFLLLDGGTYKMPKEMSDEMHQGAHPNVLELSRGYGDLLARIVETNETENERRRRLYKQAELALAFVFIAVAGMAACVIIGELG
jgi:hypothetical protein